MAMTGKGGAIHALSTSTILIEYSQLLRNKAQMGGAVYASEDTSSQIIESNFGDNEISFAE